VTTNERTTFADIAADLGTSVSTVSKVINGRPGVSDALRDRILAALDEAQYTRRGEGPRPPGKIIDFVFTEVRGEWPTRILCGAEAEAYRLGVALVVGSIHGRLLGSKRWLEGLLDRRSSGLVLVACRTRPDLDRTLRRLRVPYLYVDPLGPVPENVPTINVTNFAGARDATQHLTDLGHRRIGLITGPPDLSYSQERLDGYAAALRRAGIEYDPALVRYGLMNETSGHELGGELLDLSDRPTAVFAGSDLQAHGLYLAAAERGIAVPGDLSVVGFDNLDSGAWCSPRLTTIDQPMEDMGALAVRMILSAAAGEPMPTASRTELASTLVVRESTAPPR